MVTKVAKASTVQGKRLQAETIATTDLAIGSEAIDFTNDFVTGGFVLVAMLCYRQSERKPTKASLEGCSFTRNPVIEKESFRFKELEHQLLEKVDQLF